MPARLPPARYLSPLVVLAGLLLAPGVAPAQEPGATHSQVQPELDRVGRQIVQTRCKRPQSVKRERVPSARSPHILDVVWTTACPGFEVVTFTPSGGRARPMALTLTAAHPQIPGALGVGSRVEAVRAELGPPWSTEGDDLVYALHPERPNDDTLTFRVERGRVVALEWSWDTQ